MTQALFSRAIFRVQSKWLILLRATKSWLPNIKIALDRFTAINNRSSIFIGLKCFAKNTILATFRILTFSRNFMVSEFFFIVVVDVDDDCQATSVWTKERSIEKCSTSLLEQW